MSSIFTRGNTFSLNRNEARLRYSVPREKSTFNHARTIPMQTPFRPGLFLLFATLLFQNPSPASAQDSWVGEYILPTKPSKEIKFGDVIQDEQVYFPLSGRLELKVRGAARRLVTR